MPLQLRRDHLSLKYYARTKQNPSNPANQLVDDCIEYQIYNHKWNDHNIPYGIRVQNLLKDNDLDKIKLVTKNIQDPPPWIIDQAKTSSNIKNSISKKENPHIIKTKALEYIDNAYKNHLKIYTDGSKDPASGKTGYAFLIPSSLPTKTKNIEVTIEWTPAHVGILGNEQVDKLAKLALINDKIDLNLSLSANEFIAITTALYKKKWQARWDNTCSLWSRSINNTVNKKPYFYQVRTKEKIVKKTNYTERVIRVSDSEMESGRNRQYNGSSRRLNKTSLRRSTTLQELSGSVTQKWSQAVTRSTAALQDD
ncbi:unnamed protein product [Mytilus coruscus]|uniref:RNase H type-1 domain-containing protein n=1 Tax=Mytilus coruscus TaxID=42192 RepID=A0A6J8A8C2_MYTCO|nr:unnamed protein product [Mytilus coruscus]